MGNVCYVMSVWVVVHLRSNNMGFSNYKLTDEQKKELDIVAEEMIREIESKLSDDIGGILDPYDGRKLDNNKLTAMIWYVGDKIAYS
jgi:hypothetical protein